MQALLCGRLSSTKGMGLVLLCGLVLMSSFATAFEFEIEDEENYAVDEYFEFLEWLKLNGMAPTKVARDPNSDHGMVAVEDIEEGDVIASIPKKIKLDVQAGLSSPFSKVIQELENQGVANRQILLLYMLYEKHRADEDSFWVHYLESLPTAFPSVPLFFSAEDKAYLDGNLKKTVSQAEKNVQAIFKLVDELSRFYPTLINPSSFTLSEVRWAYHIVDSRAWIVNVEKMTYSLQPFADQFAFSASPNVVTETSKVGRTMLTAARKILKGEKVTLFKKAESAAIQLAMFGVLPDLSQNFMSLNFQPALSPDDMFSGTIRGILRHLGCFGIDDDYPLRIGEPLHPEFMTCLRVVMLTPKDYARAVEYESVTGQPFDTSKAGFSLENALASLSTLKETFSSSLASYSTSLAEDEALLSSSGRANLSANALNVILLRQSEKRILSHGVDLVTAEWLSYLTVNPFEAVTPSEGDEA